MVHDNDNVWLYIRVYKRSYAIQLLLKATGAFNERAFHILKKGSM